MEDVLELLREQAEPVSYAPELPSEDDLLDIQELLLIHLPYDLRMYLLSASDVVVGRLEPVTASDPDCHTYLPEVAANAWEQGLPRHLLPICVDGDCCYAIEQDGEILSWSLSQQDFLEACWDNLWYWIRDCWLEQHA